MTIASATSKSGPYACNGVTVAFTLGFACLAQSDLQVIRTDASGADTTLTLSTDYTVALNADQTNSPGGTVTLVVAPATGFSLTILRNVAFTQGTSLPNQGGWYPKVVESAFDKLTMIVQQLSEKVSRAVVAGVTIDPAALLTSIYNAATASAASATSSAGSASASAGSATSAAGSATAAASSASSAATNAAAVASYAPVPSQTGFTVKYSLKTNGTTQSWQLTLPDQTGKAGRALVSDGTNESWTFTGTRLVSAAGTTLTDNCYHAFLSNVSYTLPDLTTMADTFGLMALSNSTAVPANVTTSDGWSVATGMVAGTLRAISPNSKATAHGTWGSAAMTPPLLATITGSGVPVVVGSVQLSASIVVVVYQDGTNYYAVAINPITGAAGAAVSLFAYSASQGGATGCAVFADSASTFVFIANTGSGITVTAIAGSVSGTVITAGSSAASGSGGASATTMLNCTAIQLAAGLYMVATGGNSFFLFALSVSGTVVTWGAGVASGAADKGNFLIAPVSATTALVVYGATGGATSTTRALTAVVASVAGNVITLGTPAGSGSNTGAAITALGTFSAGVYFAVQTESTSGAWYGITVSGTTATLGARNVQANNLPALFYDPPYVATQPKKILKYNSTTFLFGHMTGGVMAATISGTTLTFGTPQAIPAAAASNLATDFTGAIFYVIGSAAYDKVTVAGTVLTSAYEVAVVPAIISSDTLTDKAVNYSGTWYSWTLPTMAIPISATRWLRASGNNLIVSGPIS